MNILVVGNGRAGSRWGKLARQLDHVVSFSDVDDARAENNFHPDDVQAIIVATPADWHFFSAVTCRKFWPTVPMLVEKPLDVSLDNADEWRDMGPWYVSQWRYHPMFDGLIKPVHSGRDLTLVYQYGGARGDAIMESAIHDLDLAYYLRGQFLEFARAGLMPTGEISIRLWPRTEVIVDHKRSHRTREVWIGERKIDDVGADPDEAYRRLLADFLKPKPSAKLPKVEDGLRALTLALKARDLADA